MTAIAIDDEPLALAIIKAFCARTDLIDLQKTFTETGEALKYLQKYPVDLLFLDVNMPAMSGLSFYKELGQNVMVIFTTAYSQYAVEGFDLNAVDYLLKPFEYERFVQAVDKAKEYHQYLQHKEDVHDKYLFIRADYSLIKILLNDILFIEGLDNYLKVHISNQRPVVARMSMKAMAEKLPEREFIRVHRSYIVPISKVESVRNKMIYFKRYEIPIGASYAEQVQKLLQP
ncbi:MAG: response regulator transcription factor [Taibaiella sp.]|nr:response regulator transcription factor [Taibaiella sp.]